MTINQLYDNNIIVNASDSFAVSCVNGFWLTEASSYKVAYDEGFYYFLAFYNDGAY